MTPIFSIAGLTIGLIAIAASVFIPYLYEKAKSPNLLVQTDKASDSPSEKYIHCKVVNMPHQRGFGRWFGIERNPAINTRVSMEFFNIDGKSHISSFLNKIPAKWVSAPEPLTPDRRDFDSTKLSLLYRETIPSGYDGESFSVVVKLSSMPGCYIVTGDNYYFYGLSGILFANPNFQINETKFIVKIKASSGNSSSKTTTFIITNEAFDKFTISYADNDKSKE